MNVQAEAPIATVAARGGVAPAPSGASRRRAVRLSHHHPAAAETAHSARLPPLAPLAPLPRAARDGSLCSH